MFRLGVTLIALAALLTGLFLSISFFAEPLPASRMSSDSILVGTKRPDFRLGSNSGEFVTPSDFSGKTLLINFWATWCTPCRQEMPMLMDLQRTYGPRGLQVVGIALDDVRSAREFVKKYQISYPILVGAADVMQTSAAYGNTDGVLPYSVLVDKEGIIRWQYVGEISHKEIASLLNGFL